MSTQPFAKPARVEDDDFRPWRRVSAQPLVWFAIGSAALGFAALIVVVSARSNSATPIETHQPIVAGEVASLMVYSKPMASNLNEVTDIKVAYPGSRVEVYDQFLVVITPKEGRIICPHGFYSNLRLKP